MRQFDVYENPSKGSRAFAPYLVVLQSHHFAPLDTVIVAPIVADGESGVPQLEVPVAVRGEDLFVALQELSYFDRTALRVKVSDVSEHEDEIRRAIERIFTGF